VQDPDAPMNAGEVTIQEVQNDAMPSGTQIELRGVVVTAIDAFGNRTGDLFVSEPEGGPNSGVKVFGAPLETLATLQVGDLVDITNAIKHEACNAAAPCGPVVFDDDASITEVMGLTAGSLVITKVGTSPLPTPAVVDAKALAAMDSAARVAEWEKYEGVLIKVTNARQLADVRTFGSNPGPDSNEFRITGVARVQSVLVDLPGTATFGTCYESITGIGDFFFNNLVLPRTADDLVTGGTSCLPMVTTIVELQSSNTKPELVSLTDVIVTGRDDIGNSKGYWVADAAAGAEHNGVLVFTGSTAPDAALVIGAKVATMKGPVDEFDLGASGNPPMGDTITEISSPTIGAITAPSGPAPSPATNVSVATLADIGPAGEVWEGVLVRIGPVKVTNADAMGGKIEVTDNNDDTIMIDDDAFQFPANMAPAADACIQVTGIMSVAIFDDLRTINPRSTADVTVLAANMCN
jgi:hypothetical protein